MKFHEVSQFTKFHEVLGINLTFFCGQFHVKLAKNYGFFVSFIGSKMKLTVVFELKWLKLWNRPEWVRKKQWNWRSRREIRCVPSVSLFFPDPFWRFHNFMPLLTHKTTVSFIFDANESNKKTVIFSPVFTWNCATIKNKNKWGFGWNFFLPIKQGIKSRVHT